MENGQEKPTVSSPTCTALLCCPFCGDKEAYINEQTCEVDDNIYHDFYNVYCPMCCASVDYGEDKEKTIELWNKRAS